MKENHLRKLLALILSLITLASCQQQGGTTRSYTESQRLQLDTSAVRSKNVDSLTALVNRYKRSKERDKEMAAYAELGHCFLNANRYTNAIAAHQDQLEIAVELDDTLMRASALNDLGVNYRRMGLHYEALSNHLAAVEVSSMADEESRYKYLKCMAIGYNGCGNSYMAVANYQKADEMLRKALAIETRLGSDLGMNVDCSNLGMVFEKRGMIDSARIYYNRAMYHSRKCNSQTGIAYCHMHLGSLEMKKERYDNAIEQFRKSMGTINRDRDAWLWLQPSSALAEAYLAVGKPDSAWKYLNIVRDLSAEIGTKEYEPRILGIMSELYKSSGDYQKALKTYARAKSIEDSTMNARNLFEIEKLHDDLYQRQKEKEKMRSEQHLNEQRAQKWGFAAAFLLLLTITLMMAYTHKARRKTFAVQQRYMKMKENFFTNITHEFRTPLTLILGLSHDMAQGKTGLDDDNRKRALTIEKQGKSLLTLINQILDISKLKSNIGNPEWNNGNVCAYVEMIVEGYRQYAANRGIALQYVEKNQVTMDFIPDYIGKVMNNLLSNAMKFTPRTGRVSVITGCTDNMFYIDVCDTGTGIEESALQNIFEPFYQSENGKEYIGTGIGLPIARYAVKALGGDISAESKVGFGTTFHVSIPVRNNVKRHFQMTAPPSAVVDTAAPLEKPAQNTDRVVGKDYTVLVVEDNRSVAHYIGQLLGESYNVLYAENGQQGLDKVCEAMPDVVISDVMMPVMDGHEMCRRLRADDKVAHVPIVMVTAKITDEDRLRGLEAGADAYLTKPFNSSELLMVVDKILEQRRRIAADIRPGSEADTAEVAANENVAGNAGESATQGCAAADKEKKEDDRRFVAGVTDAVYSMISKGKCPDVPAISAKICMSPSQFYRRMNDATGLTPAAFIQRVKVRKACMMLDADPAALLTDVALHCGFNEYSTFVRAFRNVCGITPKQYVRSESARPVV